MIKKKTDDERLEDLKEFLLSHIHRIDESIKVAHGDLVRVPTEVQEKVAALKELFLSKLQGEHDLKEERFAKVEDRFVTMETTRIEQKRDARQMIDDALAVQKEAFIQQNASFTLSINKAEATNTKQTEAMESKISDIKDRLTRIEGLGGGRKELWSYMIGGIGLVTGLIAIVMTILNYKH